MNNIKIYDLLIKSAIVRRGAPSNLKSKYPFCIIHHIKPCAMFPLKRNDPSANKPSNLVFLTEKEHYLAHHLLARIYGGAMSYAYSQMTSKPLLRKSCNKIELSEARITKQGRYKNKDFKSTLSHDQLIQYEKLIKHFHKQNGKLSKAIKKAQAMILKSNPV